MRELWIELYETERSQAISMDYMGDSADRTSATVHTIGTHEDIKAYPLFDLFTQSAIDTAK